jgi:hypothetical protein
VPVGFSQVDSIVIAPSSIFQLLSPDQPFPAMAFVIPPTPTGEMAEAVFIG